MLLKICNLWWTRNLTLGPLLFVMDVNDLDLTVEGSVRKFVDHVMLLLLVRELVVGYGIILIIGIIWHKTLGQTKDGSQPAKNMCYGILMQYMRLVQNSEQLDFQPTVSYKSATDIK